MANSILVLVSLVICNGMAAEVSAPDLSRLAGQDLHVTAPVMTLCQETGQQWSHVMVLEDSAMLQIGDNFLSSRNAVVFLRAQRTAAKEGQPEAYLARAYLEGQVSIKKGKKARTTAVQHMAVEGAQTMVTQFVVTGEVFATMDANTTIDLKTLEANPLYRRAINATHGLTLGPAVPESALVPKADSVIAAQEGRLLQSKKIKRKAAPAPKVDDDKPSIGDFPVQLSAVWEPAPQIHKTSMPDGQDVITASGRFYLWQKRSEDQVIEFMTDSLVLFFEPGSFAIDQENQKGNQIGTGKIQAAYLEGNIVMTEGELTTRCDEIYYDFVENRALIVNASVRMFDEKRGMPIYLRAKRLGRVSEDIYEAREVQLTTSEFYFPQTSMNASKMVLLTGDALKAHQDRIGKEDDAAGKYDARMYDVDARYGDFTFFRWPKVRTNFKRPDVPLSAIKVGNDNDFGTSIETRWHLARLLGLKEPDWLESRLALDYFSKRGFGTGIDAEWDREDESNGSLTSYIMKDRGEDDLGRVNNRRNLNPDQDIRGRFSWRNRQYLPDDWQLTTELGYVSDRNFLESMYRSEFYTDKGQETLVYLKKLRDNWAFSILNKVRINDFETMTEELPTVEFHLKGQSFWDHRLTFYSDSQVSRLRERVDEDDDTQSGSGFYSYAMTRNEVDLPLMWETIKFVPFVAGTYSYEDNDGYYTKLDGSLDSREDQVFLGEYGLQASTMFWKENPHVHSELWDINGIRHIMTPYVKAVMYEPSDDVVDMRDAIHVGLNQRWQTHRGTEDGVRSLDWIRLDMEATWVDDDADDSIGPPNTYGPAGFVFNDPSIPMLMRRTDNYFGMARDTFTSEVLWRVSDTMSVVSDVNYDLDSGHLQQFDVGLSRYVYPDLSYYVGSRYLRPVIVNVDETGDGNNDVHEKGSNSFVTAITYRLSPRYAATFSQEYNFDYGESVRSDLTIVRQYHRMFYALSLSVDESLKRNSVIFSMWPQGVKELTVGSRGYAGLTGVRRED